MNGPNPQQSDDGDSNDEGPGGEVHDVGTVPPDDGTVPVRLMNGPEIQLEGTF